jgi:HSP20 family protein
MSAVLQSQEPEVQKTAPERRYVTPEVNIFERQDSFVLQAELPGVAKEGLEISVEDSVLTLIGRRNAVTDVPAADLLYRESREADFRRSFELDRSIDTTKIAAKLEQGVLTVTLPKVEKVKPQKITVS